MSVDDRVMDLAEVFAGDDATPQQVGELASAIQMLIEDWLASDK